MGEELNELNEEERMKAENEFLKLKLMLESGAKFSDRSDEAFPPEVENIFLKNVIEFERQFEQHKRIKIFDKIERPAQFKPSREVPDDEIEKTYDELLSHMEKFGISLAVCSPNISKRELYRFALEELFACEIDNINMPGWTYNFIYDEFHPDVVYDNSVSAERCIRSIFRLEPLEYMYAFRANGLQLNERSNLYDKEFAGLVNRFKSFYEKLELDEIEISSCSVNDKESLVAGQYKASGLSANMRIEFSGKWRIKFQLFDETTYWYIFSVELEGIRF